MRTQLWLLLLLGLISVLIKGNQEKDEDDGAAE